MVFAKNISVEFPAIRDRKGYRMRRVVSFSTEKSWQSLTGTAEIVVSKYIKGYDIAQLRDMFRVDDPVVVYAGYNGNLVQEFKGYLTRVQDEQHITFTCEDEMRMLKKGQVNMIKKPCKLKDILNAINDVVFKTTGKRYDLDTVDAELGSVRIKAMTPAQVLQEIKDKYKVYSYFKNGILVSGKVFQGNNERHILNFDNQRNIKSHSLEYKRAEDLKVKVKVTSVLANGTKIEATAGDEDGQESEISLFGVNNKKDLQQKADDKLKLMKVDGLAGDVVIFGVPLIEFGDEVSFRSTKFPERDGIYYVDGTSYKYGPGAFIERVVKIGRKAS